MRLLPGGWNAVLYASLCSEMLLRSPYFRPQSVSPIGSTWFLWSQRTYFLCRDVSRWFQRSVGILTGAPPKREWVGKFVGLGKATSKSGEVLKIGRLNVNLPCKERPGEFRSGIRDWHEKVNTQETLIAEAYPHLHYLQAYPQCSIGLKTTAIVHM